MSRKDDDYHLIFGEDGPADGFDHDAFRKFVLEGGHDERIADLFASILSKDCDDAEKCLADAVSDGVVDTGDLIYPFAKALICQSRGMEALDKGDLEDGKAYLREARDCFRMTEERGFPSPLVQKAIHDINTFLDEDDEDEEDGFDPLSIDYMGFRKEFPKGREFEALLRLESEDFSIDTLKADYLENWGGRIRSRKLKDNSWRLTADGVSVKVVYQKCIEIPSRYDQRIVGGDDEDLEYLFNPSVARVAITAEVGEETSYERSVVFTKVIGAMLSSCGGVSIDIQGVLRDPDEVFDIIMRHDDAEWLCSAVTSGFLVDGTPAMSSLSIKSCGLSSFGFPEIIVKRISPDDMMDAAMVMLDLQRYIFTFGMGEPSDGRFRTAEGVWFTTRHRKKDGEHVIEVSLVGKE